VNYLIKKKLPLALIQTIDQVLELFCHSTSSLGKIDKVLLCNWAHLGDVIISTGVIPPLRDAIKGVKIGFLCSSSSSCVLRGHPEITWIHEVDHWKLNRTDQPKIKTYLKTRKSALKEIRQINYDAAIDLYPYFPNAIPLLWQTKIPIRIGYGSGGFGPLLTHCLPWEEKNQPLIQYQFSLLQALAKEADASKLQYSLPESTFPQELKNLDPYYLFHLGSGSSQKDWQENFWRETANAVGNKRIIFTGKGILEFERIERITEGIPYCLNLCNKLSWKQLCGVVQRAERVVTVDSAVAHLAETYNVPNFVIFVESHTMKLWKPPHAVGFLAPKPEEVVSKLLSL
jgi:ADP-heptose:LPS heptosyltransferase